VYASKYPIPPLRRNEHVEGRREFEKVDEIFVRTSTEKIAARYTTPLPPASQPAIGSWGFTLASAIYLHSPTCPYSISIDPRPPQSRAASF